MDTDSKARERAEVIQEVSKWSVGAGILVVALAPLAIPILVLTGVALLPLLVPLIPLALIAGLIYLPVRLVRRLRSRRRPLRRGAAEEEVLGRVELAPVHHRLVE
jgi:Flp pilus assembly protein TadB